MLEVPVDILHLGVGIDIRRLRILAPRLGRLSSTAPKQGSSENTQRSENAWRRRDAEGHGRGHDEGSLTPSRHGVRRGRARHRHPGPTPPRPSPFRRLNCALPAPTLTLPTVYRLPMHSVLHVALRMRIELDIYNIVTWFLIRHLPCALLRFTACSEHH
jgi:hypothetical protein